MALEESQGKKLGPKPDWPAMLQKLREEKRLSQSELSRDLGLTVAAVNHWEKGRKQPDASSCIKLGKLAGYPDCWYWWGRAGITEADFLASTPEIEARIVDLRMAGRYPEVIIDSGPRVKGEWPRKGRRKSGYIMLPVLSDSAAAGRPRLIEEHDIDDYLIYPRAWIPHPDMTTVVYISGDSMWPILREGDLALIDAAVIDLRRLKHKMVAALVDDGVTIKWLDRVGDRYTLVPENKDFPSHPLTEEDQIIGRVIRWHGHQE